MAVVDLQYATAATQTKDGNTIGRTIGNMISRTIGNMVGRRISVVTMTGAPISTVMAQLRGPKKGRATGSGEMRRGARGTIETLIGVL